MKISAIVFDLGNVLIPFDYDIILNKLNNIKSGLGNRFAVRYKSNYSVHRKFETWELSNDEFLNIMMEWTENTLSKNEFCELYSNIFVVNNDVASLLPKLKKNYKLVLLSNTNSIHQKYGWAKYDFLKNFDELILSHKVGAVKPDAKIYKAVEQFTNLPSAEHLFIDDVEEYVNGAKSVGWNAVQFVDYKKLIADLRNYHISF